MVLLGGYGVLDEYWDIAKLLGVSGWSLECC